MTSVDSQEIAAMTPTPYPVIDESTGYTRPGYTLTRVYRIRVDLVRVRIERDGYQHQSFAVAEVLTPDLRWTTLATHPASQWYADTGNHPEPDIDFVLGPLADRLAHRAATILPRPAPPRPSEKSTVDSGPCPERVIGDLGGRLLVSYHDPDHDLTVQLLATDDYYELVWADGISEFCEPHRALSDALARFGVLIFRVEQGGEPVLTGSPREFADTARAFYQVALDTMRPR